MSAHEVRQVPATPPGMQARRQTWPWLIGGGCVLSCVAVIVLLIVLALAGIRLGATALQERFQHGGFSCLPSDFPTYPGATFGGENYTLNGPTPGNACRMLFETKDSRGSVLDFYQSRLSSGDWQVTVTGPDEITFSHTKTPTTSGYLTALEKDGHTEITIQLYS